MKNPYIQKEPIRCMFHCLAVLFNDEDIIHQSPEKGYHILGRKVVETKLPNFSLAHKALHTIEMESIKDEKVFDFDYDTKDWPQDIFIPFIANVDSTIKGHLHSLLVLLDAKTRMLSVLDPRDEHSVEMTAKEFLSKHSLKDLECIISLDDNSQMGFDKEAFKYLFQ